MCHLADNHIWTMDYSAQKRHFPESIGNNKSSLHSTGIEATPTEIMVQRAQTQKGLGRVGRMLST